MTRFFYIQCLSSKKLSNYKTQKEKLITSKGIIWFIYHGKYRPIILEIKYISFNSKDIK